MKAILIYDYFLNSVSNNPSIGGIQTYIQDLSSIFCDLGYSVEIYQKGENVGKSSFNGIDVNFLVKREESQKKFKKAILKKLKLENPLDCLIVFMTHTLTFQIKGFNTISIQHGIYWDLPNNSRNFNSKLQLLFRLKHVFFTLKRMNSVPNHVFVDYNFLNWIRTQQYALKIKYNVIPNYANYLNEVPPTNSKIKILFARRLEEYRGTRIFADSIRALINKNYDFDVIIAGNGPDKKYLEDYFKDDKCVSFIEYKHGEQEQIMSNCDISVVCSTGSEGTSLSLLESMGCGCAVVCTNVGGMTNIVLDGFNGLICDTNSDSLASKLEILLNDKDKIQFLSKNAIETVKESFSKQKWESEWRSFILKVSNKGGNHA